MKNKKGYIVAAAVLIMLSLLVLSACRGNKPLNPSGGNTAANPTPTAVTPSPQPETLVGYFPLKVGNTWEYEGKGMEYAAYKQWVKYEKDGRYQVMVDNGGTVIASAFEVKQDSIVSTYKQGDADTNKNILEQPSNINITILKLPLTEGTSWDSEDNTYTIADTDAAVTVPAGSFDNCVVVKGVAQGQKSYMQFYYKKGVGLVQSEFHPEQGDIVYSKLKTYSLK